MGHSALCRILLENKANPNLKTKMGNTPLMCAANSGNIDIVRLLLKFNADKSIKKYNFSSSGITAKNAAQVAFEAGHIEIYKLLND